LRRALASAIITALLAPHGFDTGSHARVAPLLREPKSRERCHLFQAGFARLRR